MIDDQDVEAFIVSFSVRGYSPTYREIAAGLDCPVSTIHRSVSAMIQRGVLEHTPGRSRTLRLARRTDGGSSG